MDNLWKKVEGSKRIGIAGHEKPDGDCVGSCMALYSYIQENFNSDGSKEVDLFMKQYPEVFSFLDRAEDVIDEYTLKEQYDCFVALDCGSIDRLGDAAKYFENAKITFTIDHHCTNTAFANNNIVDSKAAATSEILYTLFDKNNISKSVAEDLYLGIVHDTGVFKHSNTTRRTMEIAGSLIETGANPSKIIDGTFYEKTYVQNQILGRCLMESILLMDGKVIVASVPLKIQQFYGVVFSDMEGIIDQLRVTKGVEVAILLKEAAHMEWKVSMRSNTVVDVAKICTLHNGGGHVKAAGCTLKGSVYDVMNTLTKAIELQMKG